MSEGQTFSVEPCDSRTPCQCLTLTVAAASSGGKDGQINAENLTPRRMSFFLHADTRVCFADFSREPETRRGVFCLTGIDFQLPSFSLLFLATTPILVPIHRKTTRILMSCNYNFAFCYYAKIIIALKFMNISAVKASEPCATCIKAATRFAAVTKTALVSPIRTHLYVRISYIIVTSLPLRFLCSTDV